MRKEKNKISLNQKIFKIVSVSMISILSFACLLTFSFSYKNSLASTENSVDLLMQQNNIVLDNLITLVEKAMLAPSNDRQLYQLLTLEKPESYVASAAKMRDINSYIINNLLLPVRTHISSAECHFFISGEYDAAALYRGISLTGGRIHSSEDFKTEEWYQDALDNNFHWFIPPEQPGRIFVTKSIVGFFENLLTQRIGVVMMCFNVSDLLSQVRDSILTANSNYFLVDAGQTWYSVDGTELKDLSYPEQIDYQVNLQSIVVDHTRYLCGISSLSNQWYFVSLTPHGDILADSSYLIRLFAIIITISVFLSLLVSLLVSRRIARPIADLSDMMLAVRNESELKLNLPDTAEIIEISQLYDSFRILIDRIHVLVEGIHQKGINEKNAEIKALQAQISPHFLFNSLDSLCWAARDTGDTELPAVITSLSDILRYSLRDFNKQVTIEEELTIVRKYLMVQQFCYSLNITFIEDVGTLSKEYTLPKLTLQPLVENAILHGMLDHGKRSDTITVRAFHRDNKVIIQVENTFPADIDRMYQIINNTAQVQKHGIRNVHSRLQMLFGEAYGLTFLTPENGGIIVEISLPE